MTDEELARAVAEECFGWRVHAEEVIDTLPQTRIPLYSECGGAFRPLTDARDAERVWDWLVGKCWRVGVTRDGTMVKDCEIHVEMRQDRPHGSFVKDAKDWKRALCLAALEVARAGRKK